MHTFVLAKQLPEANSVCSYMRTVLYEIFSLALLDPFFFLQWDVKFSRPNVKRLKGLATPDYEILTSILHAFNIDHIDTLQLASSEKTEKRYDYIASYQLCTRLPKNVLFSQDSDEEAGSNYCKEACLLHSSHSTRTLQHCQSKLRTLPFART